MNKRLVDIHERLAELKPRILELSERDDLNDDETGEFERSIEEFDTLTSEAAPLEEREAKLDRIRTAPIRESGDGAITRDVHVNVQPSTDDIYDLSRSQFIGMDERTIGSTLRDRSMRAIESWADYGATAEQQESAERLVRNASRSQRDAQVAEHILRTGSPAYMDGFEAYLRNPVAGVGGISDTAARAALAEGATTTGGFLVPPMLDPSIILTNNGTTNPFRSIATVKTITTQTWKGVTSAGVTAEWTAEAAEVADASPTFAQPTITPVRADAYIQASLEVTQDTDVVSDLGMLFADARDRLESAAFAVGTGSTQPKGVVTAVSAVTASRVAGSSGAAGAADYVVGDVYALVNALPPRHRPNASWLAEQTTYNRTRQFATGSGPQHAFWTDLGAGIPSLLLGRPVYESSEMDNTIVSGSNDDVLLFGDFKKYCIVDRVGMSIAYEPLVKGANRRPTGEVGWVAFWRVGADVLDANAFRLLRL